MKNAKKIKDNFNSDFVCGKLKKSLHGLITAREICHGKLLEKTTLQSAEKIAMKMRPYQIRTSK